MNTLIILLFIPFFVGILLALSPIIALTPLGQFSKDTEKLSSYECGFTPIASQTRGNITIAFYIVAILYLVFDLEIALLIPIISEYSNISLINYSAVIIFILILTVGFIYELASDAINWSKI